MRFLVVLLAMSAVVNAAPARKQSAALVLLIDRSGSMQGAKLDSAKAAALAAVDALAPDDQVAIIAFDSNTTTYVPLQRAGERKSIAMGIGRIQAGGGTAFLPALRAAYTMLKPLKLAHRHVILMSDGESPSDDIAELVHDMSELNITISTVGVQGADRGMLSMIADAGEGRLYMVDDLTALPKLFADEVARALR
jgi:uncharacterized protein with von Willebrand factor type A (vWA) domain